MFKKLLVNRENENTSLADIIRENSWFMCGKCEYKSKTKKSYKNHTLKTHSFGFRVNSNVGVRDSAGKKSAISVATSLIAVISTTT